MNKSQTIISKVDCILAKNLLDVSDIEENNSVDERATNGRYHVHVTGTDKYGWDNSSVVHAHVSTPEQIHSVFHRAAAHVKDGGMTKIRAKVHDTKTGKKYSHSMINSPNGKVTFDGPDPHSYA